MTVTHSKAVASAGKLCRHVKSILVEFASGCMVATFTTLPVALDTTQIQACAKSGKSQEHHDV